jgi:hypothetical protein
VVGHVTSDFDLGTSISGPFGGGILETHLRTDRVPDVETDLSSIDHVAVTVYRLCIKDFTLKVS